jgi:hypothetical protein
VSTLELVVMHVGVMGLELRHRTTAEGGGKLGAVGGTGVEVGVDVSARMNVESGAGVSTGVPP